MPNIWLFIISFDMVAMLKAFQLKVARSVTGIEIRELVPYLGVSRTIISRWEKQPPLSLIKTKRVSGDSIVFFFKQYNIVFPDDYTVKLINEKFVKQSEHLTRFQLRAARAALWLTQSTLASLTNNSVSTINYLETQDNTTFLNKTNKVVDDLKLKDFFQKGGVSFPDNLTICISPNLKL
jgi:DNA-binding transcriptional regulator YiaG